MNIAAKQPYDPIGAFRREIPDLKDIIQGELAQNGDWLVANISTNSFWPVSSQKVRWRGVDIWIMPIMKGFYPAVALKVPPGKSSRRVRRAGYALPVDAVVGRGTRLHGRGRGQRWQPAEAYRPRQGAGLALGLIREGRGLNHVGYAFLTFYRILEVARLTNSVSRGYQRRWPT